MAVAQKIAVAGRVLPGIFCGRRGGGGQYGKWARLPDGGSDRDGRAVRERAGLFFANAAGGETETIITKDNHNVRLLARLLVIRPERIRPGNGMAVSLIVVRTGAS